MIVRPASKKDAPSIIEFQKRMALETESIELEEQTLKEGVNTLFSDPSKGRYYVAEESGKVIGCLMTTFEWSDWRNGTVLWIQSVYVSEDFRGKGVYKLLYEFVQKMVRSDNTLKGIRLYVDKSNHAAQRVYEKLGMDGEHYKVFEWMG